MLRFKNAKPQATDEARTADDRVSPPKPATSCGRLYLVDVLIVLAMGILLYYGYTITTQFANIRTDVARYECYAEAFWRGTPALRTFPAGQCSFIRTNAFPSIVQKMKLRGWSAHLVGKLESHQSPSKPLHTIPSEYPLLTIIPFSLGLVAHASWYPVTFALWMALLAAILYFILLRFESKEAAIAFAFYLVAGSWATALGRFDLIPASLTLITLLLARRGRWKLAFAMLALATLLKFYALVLTVPFFIAQQSQRRGSKWYAWRRWEPLGVFVAVCVVVMGISLILSIDETLIPFSYFENRPIQVESLQASLLWLASFLGAPVHYVNSYGAVNVLSQLAPKIDLSMPGMYIGLLYTFWLQWRGKLDLPTSSLLTLLIVIITGKVFSPQYLIWVTPLVAYIGKCNWKWLVSWGGIGLVTTLIYPYMYNAVPEVVSVVLLPEFQPVLLVRNLMVLGFTLVLLYKATRGHLMETWKPLPGPGNRY